ncbi:hypothetical protein GTQ99_04770 [Kineococcus sp. T13]|uniref:hypothetical protein n=1 Tax=Kineococcus vitellinus TaxID=2696565 RepID=UPI00141263CC|nr:hypothetical protein [Kineococcus vitellinus]NAZ74737.1 hypothetical protein [Kineococcus vitellinus]
MTNRRLDPAHNAKASLLAAGIGGGSLVVAMPVFFSAVMWPVFDPGAVSAAALLAMAAVAVCAPVTVTAVIAARRRAAVRVSVLLVAVPQAVLCTPLVLLSLLGQR